jgi:hypothetical protein
MAIVPCNSVFTVSETKHMQRGGGGGSGNGGGSSSGGGGGGRSGGDAPLFRFEIVHNERGVLYVLPSDHHFMPTTYFPTTSLPTTYLPVTFLPATNF